MQLCLLTQSPIRTRAHTKQVTSANKHAHNKPHTSREVEADAAVVRRVRGRALPGVNPPLPRTSAPSPANKRLTPPAPCYTPAAANPTCSFAYKKVQTRCRRGSAHEAHTHTLLHETRSLLLAAQPLLKIAALGATPCRRRSS